MEIGCETEAKKEALARIRRRLPERLSSDSSCLVDNGPSGISGLSANTGRYSCLRTLERLVVVRICVLWC